MDHYLCRGVMEVVRVAGRVSFASFSATNKSTIKAAASSIRAAFNPNEEGEEGGKANEDEEEEEDSLVGTVSACS